MSKVSTGDNIINAGLHNGFINLAENHLQKAQHDLNRGAREQAEEHLKRVGDSDSNAILNPSSSRLTESENEEYRLLTNQRFYKSEDGLVNENDISKEAFNRLLFLDKKARGEK